MAETAAENAVATCLLPPRPRLVGKCSSSLSFPFSRPPGAQLRPHPLNILPKRDHENKINKKALFTAHGASFADALADALRAYRAGSFRPSDLTNASLKNFWARAHIVPHPSSPFLEPRPPFSVGLELWSLPCARCRVALMGVHPSSSLPIFRFALPLLSHHIRSMYLGSSRESIFIELAQVTISRWSSSLTLRTWALNVFLTWSLCWRLRSLRQLLPQAYPHSLLLLLYIFKAPSYFRPSCGT
jgi:hypothetical protein